MVGQQTHTQAVQFPTRVRLSGARIEISVTKIRVDFFLDAVFSYEKMARTLQSLRSDAYVMAHQREEFYGTVANAACLVALTFNCPAPDMCALLARHENLIVHAVLAIGISPVDAQQSERQPNDALTQTPLQLWLRCNALCRRWWRHAATTAQRASSLRLAFGRSCRPARCRAPQCAIARR